MNVSSRFSAASRHCQYTRVEWKLRSLARRGVPIFYSMKDFLSKLPLTILAIVCLLSGKVHAEPFADGETVVFLGDSITHGRAYHRMIYDYYLTRFPDRQIRFVNAGISGDSAGGPLGRLDEDVISKDPTTVVIMLGMNDVGRGNYVENPTEQQLASQASALERYRKNMDSVMGRLKKETAAKLIVMTPSPFDQTAVMERENQPGCNDALARCGVIGGELAAKYGAQVIDLHGPMTAFNLEQQKTDPAFTIIGSDRVHPDQPGILMMAGLFLKAQGVPALVSEVEFDAVSGKAVKSQDAEVSQVKSDPGSWMFTVKEDALPWPIDESARSLLELLPLEEELNREIVRVTGLGKGDYVLKIDDAEVATHSAEEWARGINLALNSATPQSKQAAAVAKIDEQRRVEEVRLRGYACVRWFMGHQRVDPDDLDAVSAFLKSKEGETGYYLSHVPAYLEEWGSRGEVVSKVLDLEKAAQEASVPVSHEYVVARQGN